MSKAQQIFDAGFNVPRDPRSPEYRAGALYILRLKTGEQAKNHYSSVNNPIGISCPYPVGTAQADAWLAGTDEGHRLWRDHQQPELELA